MDGMPTLGLPDPSGTIAQWTGQLRLTVA